MLSEYRKRQDTEKPTINLVVIGNPSSLSLSLSLSLSPSHSLSLTSLGHVDAGKSTLMGHLLFLLGHVSKKTMHKWVIDWVSEWVSEWVNGYLVASIEWFLFCFLICKGMKLIHRNLAKPLSSMHGYLTRLVKKETGTHTHTLCITYSHCPSLSSQRYYYGYCSATVWDRSFEGSLAGCSWTQRLHT